MNYIRELNAFYAWLETNSISDSAIVLWHALMYTCNKAGWITEFAVAISTLESRTGLKKGAIIRARQRLKQLNRIDSRSREGQLSAVYSIIPFGDYEIAIVDGVKYFKSDCVPLKDTNWNANRYTNRTQSGTLTGPINKLNAFNDYDNNKNTAHARDPDNEPYEFSKLIFLSSNQVTTLTDKFSIINGKNSAAVMNSYVCRLSRMKSDEGYAPSGSDYDEILRLAEEDRQRNL
jgi:hypothetical protein